MPAPASASAYWRRMRGLDGYFSCSRLSTATARVYSRRASRVAPLSVSSAMQGHSIRLAVGGWREKRRDLRDPPATGNRQLNQYLIRSSSDLALEAGVEYGKRSMTCCSVRRARARPPGGAGARGV